MVEEHTNNIFLKITSHHKLKHNRIVYLYKKLDKIPSIQTMTFRQICQTEEQYKNNSIFFHLSPTL